MNILYRHQPLSNLLLAPFTSSKKFDRFFVKWLKGRKYLATYRGRTGIYQILNFLKKNYHVTRVLVPSYICKEAVIPIKMAGLEIVFVDNDLETLGVDLKPAKDNDAVISPNLFGLEAKLKRHKNLFIIEDDASNFKLPSPSSDFAVYSFGRGKDVSSSEGGLVVVNNEKFDDFVEETQLAAPSFLVEISRYLGYLAWCLKTYRFIYLFGKRWKPKDGKKISNVIEMEGEDYSMCKISKKIVFDQLNNLERVKQRNKEIAKLLMNGLKIGGVKVLKPSGNSNHFYLNLLVEKRDSLKKFLEEHKILTSIPWGYVAGNLYTGKGHKNSSYIFEHILQILIDPTCMKKDDVLFIVGKVAEWHKKQMHL